MPCTIRYREGHFTVIDTRKKSDCVIIDETLSMEQQTNAICKSAFYQLRTISKIRKYLSFNVAEILIHTFVTSKLDNRNPLLYGIPKHLTKKLQYVQNSATRINSSL